MTIAASNRSINENTRDRQDAWAGARVTAMDYWDLLRDQSSQTKALRLLKEIGI
jgi:hypothetical protein